MTNAEEQQYLDLCTQCINEGELRDNRTGDMAFSLFSTRMQFDLSEGKIPLLTTKRMPWKTVIKELLWFISGNTDSTVLSAQGCRIWDKNGSIEFLRSIGLEERTEGDLGPVYGFQWRHWGAEYKTCKDDYTGQGIDQLKQVIETIKKDPNNRRIILSAWNVGDLKKMALPPCHMFCQFYVSRGTLSTQLYQRSADMGLGVPFNIASYSILTRMIAQVTGLKPGRLTHVMGDTHVYVKHIEPLKGQIVRKPYPFPVLTIDPTVKDIDDFRLEHFKVQGYQHHPAVEMEMSV